MKKTISLFVCLFILAIFAFPAMGEGRQLIQLDLPIYNTTLSYEKRIQQ